MEHLKKESPEEQLRDLRNHLGLANDSADKWRDRAMELQRSRDFYRVRVQALESLAKRLPEPFKTLVFDIVANGYPRWWGPGEDE